jgi:hypothetical protein
MQEIAEISTRLLRRQIRVRAVPAGLLHAIGTILGPINPMAKDLGAMMDWFGTGRYVADTSRQREVFGPLPTAEDAVARLITGLGHPV